MTDEIFGSATQRTVSVVAREIHHSIIDVVGDCDYSELFKDLREATPNDVIYLHINTQGGMLDAAIEIINGIEECQGMVVGVSEGAVVSAGSLIFFACHGFIVKDMSYFMIHDGSCGVIGKMNENHKAAQFSVGHLRLVYERVYSKFFTPEEIDKVLEGSDIYLLAAEVQERIEKVSKEMEEESEQIELGLE